jgi:hypothetical protein
MTATERKQDILLQLASQNLNTLAATLARTVEEKDALAAELAGLKNPTQPSPPTDSPTTTRR